MPLFLMFLTVPLIEIALFIQIGGLIGLWPTLLIVILTAIAGTYLVRSQGRLALGQLQQTFERLENPAEPLAHAAMILVAGVLLLTPGFFTDAVGFALLFPPVRRAAFRWIKARVSVTSFSMGPGPGRDPRRPDIVEADYTDVTPDEPEQPHLPPRGSSGWTKH